MHIKHIELAVKLAKSIVIKNESIALQVNDELGKLYPNIVISENKVEWKYYLNLTGKYFKTDIYVKLISLDTNTEIELNRTTMKVHTATKRKLLERGEFYDRLCAKYPDSVTIIEGMLGSLTLKDVLNAENGSILSYNPAHVESNELSLIRELNIFLKDFLYRWEVQPFVGVENLYLPLLIAGVTSAMLFKIVNLRIGKLHTYETHSLFMDEFFKSHRNLSEETNMLNPSVKLWLYRNLRSLERKIGSNTSFKTIVDKILTPSNILVDEIVIKSKGSSLGNALQGGVIALDRLNYPLEDREVSFNAASLIEKEKNQASKARRTTLTKQLEASLESSKAMYQKSKLIMITDMSSNVGIDYDVIEVGLSNFLYKALTIEDKEVFYVPVGARSFSLRAKDIAYLLMGLIAPSKLKTAKSLKIDRVIDTSVTLSSAINETNTAINLLKVDETLSVVSQTRELLVKRHGLLQLMRKTKSAATRALFVKIEEVVTKTKEITLTEQGINKHLLNLGIELDGLSEANRTTITMTVLELVLNVNLTKLNDSKYKLEVFSRLVDKLTSYSLQVMSNILEETITVNTFSLRPMEVLNSGDILDGKFVCFEPFIGGTAMELVHTPAEIIGMSTVNLVFDNREVMTSYLIDYKDSGLVLTASMGDTVSVLIKPEVKVYDEMSRVLLDHKDGGELYTVSNDGIELGMLTDGNPNVVLSAVTRGDMFVDKPTIEMNGGVDRDLASVKPRLKVEVTTGKDISLYANEHVDLPEIGMGSVLTITEE